jgi:methionyl-tRNA formyltransferase
MALKSLTSLDLYKPDQLKQQKKKLKKIMEFFSTELFFIYVGAYVRIYKKKVLKMTKYCINSHGVQPNQLIYLIWSI